MRRKTSIVSYSGTVSLRQSAAFTRHSSMCYSCTLLSLHQSVQTSSERQCIYSTAGSHLQSGAIVNVHSFSFNYIGCVRSSQSACLPPSVPGTGLSRAQHRISAYGSWRGSCSGAVGVPSHQHTDAMSSVWVCRLNFVLILCVFPPAF